MHKNSVKSFSAGEKTLLFSWCGNSMANQNFTDLSWSLMCWEIAFEISIQTLQFFKIVLSAWETGSYSENIFSVSTVIRKPIEILVI